MSFRSTTIRKALDRVGRHEYVLPAIQREFVWSTDQTCRLFDSLLHGYPIGTFLFWTVPGELSRAFKFYDFIREYHELKARHSVPIAVSDPRSLTAVLDGQQRLTALNIGLQGYIATRRKYGRSNDPSAYPVRQLYLDVCFQPDESRTEDAEYQFAFLSEDEARRQSDGVRWFPVSEILDLEQGPGIFKWVQQHGLAEHPSAFPTLDRLWRAVHVHEVISFFEEESHSVDRVLEIFIRTNSGGTVLSRSDLLLSIATAQFTKRDARAAVHGLVDDLNSVGQGFNFSKDLVLKAGLVITDRPTVAFRVDAFTAENVTVLDEQWDRIERSLRVTARLLAAFGFSDRTLSAASVALPIADYLAFRQLGDEYVDSATHREDRDKTRTWIMRSLLKPGGIWGSGLDSQLMRLRRVVRQYGSNAFPDEALESELAAMGKSLRLTDEELQELVETPITNRRTFPLLALLYPGIDVRNEFHIDHVFPRSGFETRKLEQAGVDGDLHDEYQELRDRLPNLQLLEGSINSSKQAMPPEDWAERHLPDPNAREGWLAAHDLTGLPATVAGFLDFYERRRNLMLSRLRDLCGLRESSSPAEASSAVTDSLFQASSASWDAARRRAEGVARRKFDRSLSDVPDGPVVYRVRGVEHAAEVRDGVMVLADGRTFESPSAAAGAVNRGVSVNGWRVWSRDGRSLADLVDA
jgi:Protein of unknown function DUF262/Protein of unknown function (DUF1524)